MLDFTLWPLFEEEDGEGDLERLIMILIANTFSYPTPTPILGRFLLFLSKKENVNHHII